MVSVGWGSPGATGAAGTSSPPARPLLAVPGHCSWGGWDSEERCLLVLGGAWGAWHDSDPCTGSIFPLCTTNHQPHGVLPVHEKIHGGTELWFQVASVGCLDSIRGWSALWGWAECFLHMGYCWAGSALLSPAHPTVTRSRGSLPALQQRVLLRGLHCSPQHIKCRTSACQRCILPNTSCTGLWARAQGAVTNLVFSGWGLLAPGEVQREAAPPLLQTCALFPKSYAFNLQGPSPAEMLRCKHRFAEEAVLNALILLKVGWAQGI